jgi:hypothetical protein
VTAEAMHGLYEIVKTTDDIMESGIDSKEWFKECQRTVAALSVPISHKSEDDLEEFYDR